MEDRAYICSVCLFIGDWLENMKRIKWYRKLYMGENAKKSRYKIVWKVTHKAGLINTYLITIPKFENNQLEIINSSELLQKHYNDTTTCIVGIAVGYDEALKLVETIVSDVLTETKGMCIREYFQNKMGV